ncbi:hypothetical protein Q8G81_27735, partial [Klebsiella pneumoniae]
CIACSRMLILHHFFRSPSNKHYGGYYYMGYFYCHPTVASCTNDCITTVFDAKPFGWLLIMLSATMLFFIVIGIIKR